MEQQNKRSEVEKMRNGQLADMSVPEMQVRFEKAKKLLARMRGLSTYDEEYRPLLEELVPDIPVTSIICPPSPAYVLRSLYIHHPEKYS